MIAIGNANISDIRIGGAPIDKVYRGNDLIWERRPAFVAVGADGAFMYSSDGANWTAGGIGGLSGVALNAVAFGNGRFVAVGGGGRSLVSTNGKDWTENASGSSSTGICVAFGSGMFAAGYGGKVYTSSDGSAWTERSSITSGALRGVTFSNGTFLIVGDSGKMRSSGDGGVTWTDRTMTENSPRLCGVAFGNGAWVAVSGNLSGTDAKASWRSTNLSSWSSKSFTYIPTAIAFGNGVFVAVQSSGYMRTSSDGSTWGSDFRVGTGAWRAVTFARGRFVAVGAAGTVATSTDGANWSEVKTVGSSDWLGVTGAE